MPIQHFSHIGLCVADLDASLSFYTTGLGFREIHRLEVSGAHAEQLLGLSNLDLEVVYLERDGTCIELLHYRAPGYCGEKEPRPINAPGLTHLSLVSDDLDGDSKRLQALGGRVLDSTRIHNPAYESSAVFLLDPDGTRIELVQRPGDPRQLPGA